MTWSGELWFPRCYLPSRKHCCKIAQANQDIQPHHKPNRLGFVERMIIYQRKTSRDGSFPVKQLQIFKSHRKRSLLKALLFSKDSNIERNDFNVVLTMRPMYYFNCIGLRSKSKSVLNELHKQRDHRRICCDFKQIFSESSFALRYLLELPTLEACYVLSAS